MATLYDPIVIAIKPNDPRVPVTVPVLTVMSDKSTLVFFSRPSLETDLFQTFSSTLSQMHVVVFSENVFHVGNLLYPTDI